MKAIGYRQCHPVDHPDALVEFDQPDPVATGRDLLVEVRAVSVNPVDTKIRRNVAPPEGQAKVLGWDAAGVVRAVGDEVTLFKPGDRVMYAGSIMRPGTNSELHLVDERIAGPMPQSLDFDAAAALPLTSITAWEMLFDRLRIAQGDPATGDSLLIVGAGGGVGSIMVQLARQLTGLTVVATASRPETRDWLVDLGAHHVIDHAQPMSRQLEAIGVRRVQHVASLTHTDVHLDEIVASLVPQGQMCLIDDPAVLDVMPLKRKSISLHWELMFTRSMFETADMIEQNRLLARVAQLVDAGAVRSTVAQNYGRIAAKNLLRAHALVESGRSRGKVVLAGF